MGCNTYSFMGAFFFLITHTNKKNLVWVIIAPTPYKCGSASGSGSLLPAALISVKILKKCLAMVGTHDLHSGRVHYALYHCDGSYLYHI